MSVEPKPDFSEFADFADTLREQRLRNEQVVRRALNRAKAHYPVPLADELNDVSCSLRESRSARITRAASERASRHLLISGVPLEHRDAFRSAVDPEPVARHGLGLAGDFALEGWCVKQAVWLSNAHQPLPRRVRQALLHSTELHGGDR